MKLGDLLVRAGLITEEQLSAALLEQKRWGGRLGEILVHNGLCSEEIIVRALSKQLGIPRADFDAPVELPHQVVARLPYAIARELNVAPHQYFEKERTLVVAMVDPRDTAKIERLSKRTGWRIAPAIASASALIRARARIYGVNDELLLDAEDQELKLTDSQGRTLVRSIDELAREREERRAAREAREQAAREPQARAEPAPPRQAPAQPLEPEAASDVDEIVGFTDKKGRTLIRSIDEIRREAQEKRAAKEATGQTDELPSRADLLATIEALQAEVAALKAVAVVLFKKGYITYDEYQRQLNNRAP
ncbi:MAG: hypothetical protein ACOX6T_23455 [Myxococcales bacterium]|jgi:hypothetical protein